MRNLDISEITAKKKRRKKKMKKIKKLGSQKEVGSTIGSDNFIDSAAMNELSVKSIEEYFGNMDDKQVMSPLFDSHFKEELSGSLES